MELTTLLDSPWLPPAVGAALVVVPTAWRYARHAVTLVHELGHAGVAVATGRRLSGISLHADTSGLTVSRGKPRGPGMVATAAAGYLAPSVVGLLLITAVRLGWVTETLWVAMGLLAVTLVFIRNLFGLVVVLAAGAAVGVTASRADADLQVLLVASAAWFWLLAGPRTVVELWGHRRRSRTGTSDADVLARLTHVPAAVWNLVLLALTLAALWPAVDRLLD
ncbi:MAG: M50 family metallopeptidase [Aeromicrobium sp.]|uniref:M50 family metallopeptidase n=1 Tax=Aeromicrobium sp. TaxID=1871063 RepID=UPI00260BB08C|nr:M50 family metallopeptidase [Aeromicrobium sp.]MDF1703356.1 M50 family metallopeptidase [Aeromicrobium sp.]